MEEKEIKLKVDNFKKLIDYLLKNGAEILNATKEVTIRMDTPNKDLKKRGLFLRVRSGSKKVITLKEKLGNDERVKTRKETEFEIENIKKMIYILGKLGFDYRLVMEKYRINLKYKGAKLSIDELPFGIYLEIEGSEKTIYKVAKELGYTKKEKILLTYWDLFDIYKKKNKKRGTDIVFPKNYNSKTLSSLDSFPPNLHSN